MVTLLVSEILQQVNDAPVKQEKPGQKTKKSILKKNKDNKTLQWIIYGAMNESLKFPGLDQGIDKINFQPDESPEGHSPSHLAMEIHKMKFFVEGTKDGMAINNNKRLQILQGILESVHVSEACLLGDMFKKDLQIDGLTEKLVREIWPDLLPEKEK